MGERSRRRVRDLVTQLAFEGLSENEIGRAPISMMARSHLLHARAGYRSARPTTVPKIQLATHGRSIQLGHFRRIHRRFRMVDVRFCAVRPEARAPAQSVAFGRTPVIQTLTLRLESFATNSPIMNDCDRAGVAEQ